MTDANPLFTPLKIGNMHLSHRIALAPLTRCRAVDTDQGSGIPCANAVQYYAERATKGGLVITEGTLVSEFAHGYPNCPGVYTREQIAGWAPIVKAVHDKGGYIVMQLWHCGRASHQDYQPNGEAPVSSSAVPVRGQCFSMKSGGMVDYPTPRALELEELPGIVDQFRQAARNAIDVGFDGVEIHGANGYLLNQFLVTGINKRNDSYGGSLENRLRFPLEVFRAVVDEVGAERVGYRLSPFGGFLDVSDETPVETHLGMIEKLIEAGPPAYIHCVEPRCAGNDDIDPGNHDLGVFEEATKGKTVFMRAGGYTPEMAKKALEENKGDIIAFGRWFLANPDFVERVRLGAELNKYDRDTFYTPDPVVGYIDYPAMG
jgi:12-oxophytodienoic acid reductase